MNEKKSYQAWTISDEFWEAIKGEIPKKERDQQRNIRTLQAKGESQCQQETRWKDLLCIANRVPMEGTAT